MAFLVNNFSPVGANARRGVVPQHFAYTTPDSLATVKTSGYFDEQFSDFEPNDWIFVTSSTGGTIAHTIIFIDAITVQVVTIQTIDINAA